MLAMQLDKGHFIPKTIKIQFPPCHECNGWIIVDKMIIANTNEFEKGVLEQKKYRITEETTCVRTHTATRDSALLTHQ